MEREPFFQESLPSMSNTASVVPVGSDRDFYRFVWLILALFLSYLCVATAAARR